MKKCYEIDNVMKYFNEISKIPRKSGNEEKIADYIENFAKERNFQYIRDKNNNIIITKESSSSGKNGENILLQCHMDMVCEKNKDCNHDFERDSIEVYIDGDFIKAKGTTLGADNGIGVAIILAILDSKDIRHPKIEAIFTVQEETTMLGAQTIDVSSLEGNKMICLDNMRENELLVGCAVAKIFECNLFGNRIKIDNDYKLAKISINGFLGGHSGNDISKGRGNPIKELINLLELLVNKDNIYINNIYGGEKVNVIPRDASCEIFIKSSEIENVKSKIKKFEEMLKNKQNDNFNNVRISFEFVDIYDRNPFDLFSTKNIIEIIKSMPNEVFFTNEDNEPLVSLNIGKIYSEENFINLLFSIRSNRSEKEKELLENLKKIFEKYNVKVETSQLPGYEHKSKSNFVDKCKQIYIDLFDKNPKMVDMHICLEAGFFGEKIPNLDFIAISPDIFDCHSPTERCSISSLKRIYNYIIVILENFN